mmetsp:Transcript_24159/g.51763  ORF Transcript_24159/g.51763 Transcript_24159/m.51763 type:complete len:88 (+) Transcript_24159:63-326(+)
MKRNGYAPKPKHNSISFVIHKTGYDSFLCKEETMCLSTGGPYGSHVKKSTWEHSLERSFSTLSFENLGKYYTPALSIQHTAFLSTRI